MLPQYLDIPFNTFKISTSVLEPTLNQQCLMIHGGARSQDIFHDLRIMLAQHHIGSLSFDAIGHGKSSGRISDSSLALRSLQALHVLEHHATPVSMCFGVSMGAYNAIKLSQHIPIHSLVLVVPGVYTPEAYDIHFGTEFSQIIRHKNSWLLSDAWEIIQNFKGRLLIVSAEKDEVVPNQIPQKLFDSATQCEWKHHLVIPKAIHKGFMEYLFSSDELKNQFSFYLKKCLFIQ